MAKSTRISREKETVEAMIQIYCTKHHHSSHSLCPDCQELLNYAHQRLDHCKFGEIKPVCGDCKVHCYRNDMRDKIREIMRYSGPRMISSHPLMALRHVLDKKNIPHNE
jgi:predicted amidophosphoribosyltransferase